MYHIIIFEQQIFLKIAHVSDLARAEIKTFRSNFWDNFENSFGTNFGDDFCTILEKIFWGRC